MKGPGTAARGTLAARAALALYPPSWRARYADEVGALLEESGGGPAAVASLAWRAIPAWIWPPRQLHDPSSRMRASVVITLAAGSMLAGLGLVFAQLTQLQGFRPPGHPVIGWAYAVFDGALGAAALIAAVGGLPLWLLMLRRANRELRREFLSRKAASASAASGRSPEARCSISSGSSPDAPNQRSHTLAAFYKALERARSSRAPAGLRSRSPWKICRNRTACPIESGPGAASPPPAGRVAAGSDLADPVAEAQARLGIGMLMAQYAPGSGRCAVPGAC